MIKGLGTDIVKVSRFNDVSESFLKRVFHPLELDEVKAISNTSNYLAKRFAAKEALYKAVNNKIEFRDIAVLNKKSGEPYFQCSLTDTLNIHLSISDEKDYAIATVIVEDK